VNDSPQAVDDNLSTTENLVLAFHESQLLSNDIDPDLLDTPPDQLIVQLETGTRQTSLGAAISYNAATGMFEYDPTNVPDLQSLRPGESVVDTFTYSIADLAGASETPPQTSAATVFVTVNGVNNAPIAVNDSPTLLLSGPTTIDVLANDLDPDGNDDIDPTTVRVVPGSGPFNGSVSIDPVTGVIRYTPFGDEVIFDEFRYTVQDMAGATSNRAVITLSLNPAPIARPDAQQVSGNRSGDPATSTTISVLGNDFDPGASPGGFSGLDPETLDVTLEPRFGTAVLQDDGTIVYTPAPGFVGEDRLAYTVKDLEGRTSNSTTVQLLVDSRWLHNQELPADVNRSGEVSALDALLIINYLNSNNSGSIPVTGNEPQEFLYDTSGDNVVSALDALRVINHLNGMDDPTPGTEPLAGKPLDDESLELLAADQTLSRGEDDRDEEVLDAAISQLF